jgi:hypothetical protein
LGDKRNYLKPKFEFDVGGKSAVQLKDMASWNWDLAKRKVKKVINQHKSDKEYKAKNPPKKKEPGLGLGRTADLLERIDD